MNRIAAACCCPSTVDAPAALSQHLSAQTHRADTFRKAPTAMGSNIDLSDVHSYPFRNRKSVNRPIRLFLWDAENDLDNQFGNWPLANKPMAKALETRDDDDKLVVGSEAICRCPRQTGPTAYASRLTKRHHPVDLTVSNVLPAKPHV